MQSIAILKEPDVAEQLRNNGFEVLAKLPPAALPQVVFVTAYDQFALQAFEVHAVDYVLKPLQLGRLAITVQRLKERIGKPPAADRRFMK